MKQNVGKADRILRALGAAGMLGGAFVAPVPLAARVACFGLAGAYMLFTAMRGTCLGYRLLGKSTCQTGPG